MTAEEVDTRAEKIMAWLRTFPVSKTPPTADERAGFDRLEARARSSARRVTTDEIPADEISQRQAAPPSPAQ